MSMVDLKIDDRECLGALDKAIRKAEHKEPLMRQLAGDMHDAVEENFDQEGRPKWKGLRPSTIRNRKRKGNWPGKILQVRGRLASSIQSKSTATTAIVGTNVAYARIQHFGGTTKHAARDRIMHFKAVSRGKMTHGHGGDRFAKPGKASYAMKTQGKAYTATIPARPFMTLTARDIEKMKRHAQEYVANQ